METSIQTFKRKCSASTELKVKVLRICSKTKSSVENVYSEVIGNNEANISTLQMLTSIENKFGRLLDMQETLPEEALADFEKKLDKDRRARLREEKRKNQEALQKERVARALERSQGDFHFWVIKIKIQPLQKLTVEGDLSGGRHHSHEKKTSPTKKTNHLNSKSICRRFSLNSKLHKLRLCFTGTIKFSVSSLEERCHYWPTKSSVVKPTEEEFEPTEIRAELHL